MTCSNKVYKKKIKEGKIANSNLQTIQIKNQPLTELKFKEFLTVKQLSLLLGFLIRTVYRLINDKKISSYNFSERKTLIRRSDIDALFEKLQIEFEVVIRPVEKRK